MFLIYQKSLKLEKLLKNSMIQILKNTGIINLSHNFDLKKFKIWSSIKLF